MPLVPVGPGPIGASAGGRASPAVVIASSPGHEGATRVQFGEWEGPLGLLLSLIEARRLDVLTVPLGALAEAYLEALASIATDRIGHISAFVAVAGQLILMKSRAMLPRQAEPDAFAAIERDGTLDPEDELRARLVAYRAYRDAGTRLAALGSDGGRLFRREPSIAAASGSAGARPPEGQPLDVGLLSGALADLLRVVPPPEPPPEVVSRTVTLAERAAVIRAALRGAGPVVLQEILRHVRDRVVVAVTFLALLELVKRREIVVEQQEPFGPIVARRPTAAEQAAGGGPAAPDETFDETLGSFA